MTLHRSPRNGAAQVGLQASSLPLCADAFMPPAERDTQDTLGHLGGFRATDGSALLPETALEGACGYDEARTGFKLPRGA